MSNLLKNKVQKVEISQKTSGQRLDNFLRKILKGVPNSLIYKIIRDGQVRVNSKRVLPKYRVEINDIIRIPPVNSQSKIVNIAHDLFIDLSRVIVYENNDFIIINKWAGISTQGGTKVTLSIDQIINSISEKYNLVHRLDKQTSGVLIISKNYSTTRFFGKLFKDRKISKTYIALCKGKIKERKKTIELDLNKQKYYKKNSIVANKDKKISLTNYEVLEYKSGISSVVFLPLSGRMHQIRVVAKYLNSPILGDSKYNNARENNKSELMLHSSAINFLYKNKKQFFVAEIPEKMKNNFKKYGLKIPKNKFIEQYN